LGAGKAMLSVRQWAAAMMKYHEVVKAEKKWEIKN
jgi:hypothetical protein